MNWIRASNAFQPWFRKKKAGLLPGFFVGVLLWILPGMAMGEVTKGVYGVPSIAERDPSSYLSELEKAGVNAVFVKPDRDTVKWFNKRGFQVYVSIDAYGGKGAWKKYPDSRPVLADGSLLGENPEYACHGGACPTHVGWKRDRLSYIEGLLRDFDGADGRIDGIWLDYIRYPGRWSVLEPNIPDTCYCERCLNKFSKETGIAVPKSGNTKEAARWIKENCPYEWMKWKKDQIASFVAEVRRVLDQRPIETPPLLGLFLVPWTKGERQNAVSFAFGQDGFQLGKYADVLSPMVYHKRVGRPPSWVGFMTQYYEETVPCQVWPIVQAMDCTAEEFAEVMKYAGQGGADGVLGYPFNAMNAELWPGFRAFHRAPNLMVNGLAPQYDFPNLRGKQRRPSTILRSYGAGKGAPVPSAGATGQAKEGEVRITNQQITNNASRFQVRLSDEFDIGGGGDSEAVASQCIGISPGYGECGEWVTPIPPCEPGAEYQFRGEFYQRVWENGAYPTVCIWGQDFLLNTHWRSKIFQPLRAYVICPSELRDSSFRFINCNPQKAIWLRKPELRRFYRFNPSPPVPLKTSLFDKGFFPIGVWVRDVNDFEKVKRLALNTVLFGGRGEKLKSKVEKCHEVGLRYVLSAPHDPDRLPVYLDEISRYVRPYDLAFYVNDEPGIHSFPTGKAVDVNRLIKERFTKCATCMAVVRPQVCGEYEDGADFFMLDQYPVPFMPMTWLSDCMNECAGGLVVNGLAPQYDFPNLRGKQRRPSTILRSYGAGKGAPVPSAGATGQAKAREARITNQQITNNVARGRLASVIQAFGGKSRLDHPRLPTWQEMDCLAFLSVIHGSRGVFFFTFSWIGKTEEGRERLGRVVGRLNRVYPWLVEKNLDTTIPVDMLSENRFDPKGRAPVHCCLKRKGNEWLLIAVNTIGTYVEARVGVEVNGYSLIVSGEDGQRPGNDSRITNQQITNNSAKRTAREVFSGEDYPLVEGKIRVRFGPYEVKAFLFPVGN